MNVWNNTYTSTDRLYFILLISFWFFRKLNAVFFLSFQCEYIYTHPNHKNETQFFKHDNIYTILISKNFFLSFSFSVSVSIVLCGVFCCFVIPISIQARIWFHVCQNSNTRRSEMRKQNGDWANSLPVKEWIDKRITKCELDTHIDIKYQSQSTRFQIGNHTIHVIFDDKNKIIDFA